MEGSYPTVLSVKVVHACTSYISSYKFQFKFSLTLFRMRVQKDLLTIFPPVTSTKRRSYPQKLSDF